MKLSPQEIEFAYPKLLVEDYDRMVRRGLEIAETSSLLVVTTTDTPDLELFRDITELFKTVQIPTTSENESVDFWMSVKYDYSLWVDRTITWINTDGILNSLGWMEYLEAHSISGILRNRRFQAIQAWLLDTDTLKEIGEHIDWDVGNLPMKIKSDQSMIRMESSLGKGSWINPSLVGLL